MKKANSLRTILGLCTALCLAFAMPTWAKGKTGGGGSSGGGGSTTTLNVTTTVSDYSGGVLLLMRSDDYNGTNQASYTTTGTTTGVQSYIDSSGEWWLDLYRQSASSVPLRTLFVTPGPGTPPAGDYWQNVEVSSVCRDSFGNKVPFQNVLTYSNNCSLDLDFNTGNGTVYKLVMTPKLPAQPSGQSPAPATGLVTVSCNSTSTNSNGVTQCVNWTVVPNTAPGAPNPNAANLYTEGSQKGQIVWTFIGQYENTFLITVSNP